jgi:hypothetical protein
MTIKKTYKCDCCGISREGEKCPEHWVEISSEDGKSLHLNGIGIRLSRYSAIHFCDPHCMTLKLFGEKRLNDWTKTTIEKSRSEPTAEQAEPAERQAQQNVALERAKLVCGFAERAAAVFRDSAMCIHWCDIRGDANYHGTQHLNALRDGNDVLVVDRTNNKVTRMAGMINESQPEGQVNEGSECD